MVPLFPSLTGLNLMCLLAAGVPGCAFGGTERRDYHQLAGAAAALVCCGVHCVVFTYFVATAKWVQHAVSVKRLAAAPTRPTRSFRAQAFPAALAGIAAGLLAAFSGAAADNYHGSAA